MVKLLLQGNAFNFINSENFQVLDELPVGVYNIEFSELGGCSIVRYMPKFNFSYTLYNLDLDFIQLVKNSFTASNTNLGILLTGAKGSGKTVLAKFIANEMNLPVIILSGYGEDNDNVFKFVSQIPGRCVIFLDEFDKSFGENDGSILKLMDGVYSNTDPRLFILTSNTMDINDNLKSRPSRIRYIKEFGRKADSKTITEYLKDNLKNQELLDETFKYIRCLAISTLDVIQAVCAEVNLYGAEAFENMKKYFHIEVEEFEYMAYMYYSDYEFYITHKEQFTLQEFAQFMERYKCVQDADNNQEAERIDYGVFDSNHVRKAKVFMRTEVPLPELKVGDYIDCDYSDWEILEIDGNTIIARNDDQIRVFAILSVLYDPSKAF